jgi:hypothetical protein
MAAPTQHAYDVYISYSSADRHWVQAELLPAFARAGLRVFDTDRDFEVGVPKIVNVERAMTQSRKIMLVLTPEWLDDDWQNYEALLMQSSDPASQLGRTVPLLLKPCELPPRLTMLTWADFVDAAARPREMERLIKAIGVQARIFISYKRKASPDEALALRIFDALSKAGHAAFIDRTLTVGMDWTDEIKRQIDACDFFIVLLSELSSHSEMVAEEIKHASLQRQLTGRSRLLPVRVAYAEQLPYTIRPYLDAIQQATWESDADTERVIVELLGAVSSFSVLPTVAEPSPPDNTKTIKPPTPAADLRFIETLREPGGATRLRSEFYIRRDGDERLQLELSKKHGTISTIRAPRQTGKSSLLIRGVAQSVRQGARAVAIDLQSIESRMLTNLDDFLGYFATMIVARLRLDVAEVQRAWQSPLSANDKTTYLMEEYVLPQLPGGLILAIDEADRLLSMPLHDSFFGLVRSWHNSRAVNELWDRLDIVMVISTEPSLLIKDEYQSPFNVGQRIVLEDFNAEQVADLNQRYHGPIAKRDLPDMLDFLNGQPYLTRRAMYTMLTERRTWAEMKRSANLPQGPFGDHLRRYLWLLRDRPELRKALKQIIAHGSCADEMMFYRLSQAGLVKGASGAACTCRCRLYELYFKDKL